MKYIIGNWKANKNLSEVNNWLETFIQYNFSIFEKKAEIIICPPFPFMTLVREKLKNIPALKVGGQDISGFEKGPYTGEITAATLADIIDYVIIGHSERRKNFHESDDILDKKCQLALKYKITPIFCVRNEKDPIPDQVNFVAYEPVHSIGTGSNEPVDKVLAARAKIIDSEEMIFIYGGSVTEDNAGSYLKNPLISGVLPGGASLHPEKLYNIALAAIA